MKISTRSLLRTLLQLAVLTGISASAIADCDNRSERNRCDSAVVTPYPGGVWTPGDPIYGTKIDADVPVTMSDGTVLMVDVSYPTDLVTGARAHGPFPVLLTQTPYLFVPATAGDFFVKRGYIFVTASVRGTRKSGGDFLFFSERDAKDGAELVQWAASSLQSSNGKVGLHGGSWAGLNQIYTAVAAGPNSPIKAMAPSCFGAEFYRETYFAGGIPTQTAQFPPILGNLVGNNHGATSLGQALASEVYAGGPRSYFNDFWKTRSPGTYAKQLADLKIPVLIWGTHLDIYTESSLSMYAYLQNAYAGRPVYGPMDPKQKVTGRYQAIVSQGGHCQFEGTTTGQNIANTITLEWFDTWMKGQKTRMADTDKPLHVHELISNNWVSMPSYPAVSHYKQYFLAAPGVLSKKPEHKSSNESIIWAQPGSGSQLTYDGPVLKKGATLAGPMSASLYAASSKSNLQLIASVSLVGADGAVTPISSGAVLGSLATNVFQRSWFDEKGVPVRPYGAYTADNYRPAGSINRYDFVISPKFVAIPAGSKVRLVITTQVPSEGLLGVFSPPPANSACSPGLGTDPCFPTQPQVASLTGNVVTLHYGPKHRSSLNLPLLQPDCFAPEGSSSLPQWGRGRDHHHRTNSCQHASAIDD